METIGLIGYPLTHSFSKKYFEEKFRRENISGYIFELYPAPSIEMFESLCETYSPAGLAVTIPHKQSVINYLTEVDPVAREIGAVNCIKFSGNKRIGFNTDWIGFEKSLLPLLNDKLKRALILGSGGSAKAVQYVLKKNNIPFLTVSRSLYNGIDHINYNEVDETLLGSHKLIINCTPLGMTPDIDSMPDIPYELLGEDHLLYDLVYTPQLTKFLNLGLAHGTAVKNGMEMLEIQAEENWRIWTGEAL